MRDIFRVCFYDTFAPDVFFYFYSKYEIEINMKQKSFCLSVLSFFLSYIKLKFISVSLIMATIFNSQRGITGGICYENV